MYNNGNQFGFLALFQILLQHVHSHSPLTSRLHVMALSYHSWPGMAAMILKLDV
jgi:hypothetical protein